MKKLLFVLLISLLTAGCGDKDENEENENNNGNGQTATNAHPLESEWKITEHYIAHYKDLENGERELINKEFIKHTNCTEVFKEDKEYEHWHSDETILGSYELKHHSDECLSKMPVLRGNKRSEDGHWSIKDGYIRFYWEYGKNALMLLDEYPYTLTGNKVVYSVWPFSTDADRSTNHVITLQRVVFK